MYYKVFLEWKIGVNYNRYFFPGLFTKLGYDLLFFFRCANTPCAFRKKIGSDLVLAKLHGKRSQPQSPPTSSMWHTF